MNKFKKIIDCSIDNYGNYGDGCIIKKHGEQLAESLSIKQKSQQIILDYLTDKYGPSKGKTGKLVVHIDQLYQQFKKEDKLNIDFNVFTRLLEDLEKQKKIYLVDLEEGFIVV